MQPGYSDSQGDASKECSPLTPKAENKLGALVWGVCAGQEGTGEER